MNAKKEIEIKLQPIGIEVDLITYRLGNMEDVKTDKKEITDWYYDNPEKTFYKQNEQGIIDVLEYVRIRKEDGKWFKCYKTRYVNAKGYTSEGGVDEKEKEVDKNAVDVLEDNGYTVKAVIEKTRWVYLVDDTFEVAIDVIKRVKVAGKELKKFTKAEYVEVELKNDCQDSVNGRKQIKEFLKSKLKLHKIKEFDRGYICIFLNPHHDFSETTFLK